jgi:hypothetical protein
VAHDSGGLAVRRRPQPKRQQIPARVVQGAARAVGQTLSQAVRAPQRPARRVSRPLDRTLPGVRAVTHPAKPRRSVVDSPIVNPFARKSIAIQSHPFGLNQELAGLKSLGALRGSYTPATAMREYRQYVNKTYKRAQPFYPGSTKQVPHSDFGIPNRQFTDLAEVFTIDPHSGKVIPPSKRGVHFTPQDAWDYVLHPPRSPMSSFSRFVPLHEWVHVNQRNPAVRGYSRKGLSHALIEGGAQAFAQQLAPALGIPLQSRQSNPQYASLADFVRKAKGQRYVQRGQFGY